MNKNKERLIYNEISKLISSSKQNLVRSINSELVILYWSIGNIIKNNIERSKNIENERIFIKTLSLSLTQEFGPGWSRRQLLYCIKITEIFPNLEKVHTVCALFTWSHLRLLIHIDDELKRNFYIEISKIENWSVRQLQERIRSNLYERTAISKKPSETIVNELSALGNQGKMSPDLAFRDPYILDFLGLKDTYSERDLESSILAEMQRFIIELGSDFAFLAKQKRITIDNRDYYIDLLFFHRRLKCLVVVDLKIGEFEAGYKGQMELYLKYLEKYEQLENENSPIGLILCTGKSKEHIEILDLDKSNIRVADYLTVLPDKKVLEERLHRSVEIAEQKLLSRKL